jgi:protein-tyrosine phosphatase
LQQTRIDLQVYPGMEIFGTEHTAGLLQQGQLLTLNGSRYPLVEFDFVSDGQEETRILRSLLDAGYTPVIAHPERYQYVHDDPQLVNLWIQMGCLLQINKGSLLGRFGERIRQMAMELVGRGFATVVGSDAHYANVRTPWMYDVWDLLARQFAPVAAKVLLRTNPEKIIKNQMISPEMPEWF